ncbi:MAG: translation initiation factor IF-6 [Thermoplasmata archaeon]
MINKISILKSDFIGIYAKISEDIAVLPKNIEADVAEEICRSLGVKPLLLYIDNSYLIGSMITMNSKCVVLPPQEDGVHTSEEFGGRRIFYLKDKFNALGNDIVVNDRSAIVHQGFSTKSMREIEDNMDVEVIKATIGGIKTVGSASVLTKKGMIVTPTAEEDEIDFLENYFKVGVKAVTANFGSMYVGSSVIANSKGVFVGESTTPIELGRIDDALS